MTVLADAGLEELTEYAIPAPEPGTLAGAILEELTEYSLPLLTLTDADIVGYRWAAGDRVIINRIICRYDWNEEAGQCDTTTVFTFDDSARKYGNRPPLIIESKMLTTDKGAEAYFKQRAIALAKRYAEPPQLLEVQLQFRQLIVEVGDVVTVTCVTCPNVWTGVRGLYSEPFVVINASVSFAPQGLVSLTLQALRPTPNGAGSVGASMVTTPGPTLAGRLALVSPFSLLRIPGV